MRLAEKLARVFHEASEQIQVGLGHRPADQPPTPWEEVPVRERVRLVVTIAYLLERHEIRGPEMRQRQLELANPKAVQRDVEEIRRLVEGLEHLYNRAHEEVLAGGGGGDLGAGRGSLQGVDPTRDQALDGLGVRDRRFVAETGRARRRQQVRQVAESIREARNRLFTSRGALELMAPVAGFRQPEMPAADSWVSRDQFEETKRKQEERARGGDV